MRHAGGHEDRAARIRSAEQGIERADQPPIGGEIDGESKFPRLWWDMGQRRQAAENGGVADQHVEPAEALVESRPERIDTLAVSEIEGNERSLAALGSNPIVDLFQSFP